MKFIWPFNSTNVSCEYCGCLTIIIIKTHHTKNAIKIKRTLLMGDQELTIIIFFQTEIPLICILMPEERARF